MRGLWKAWITVVTTGGSNSRDPSRPRQHHHHPQTMELERLIQSLENQLARKAKEKARYRAKYPEKVAASNKRYRENNRAKIAEAKKRYRENNREKIREAKKRYRATHREEHNAKRRQWYKTEQYREYRRQYRAKKRKRDKEKKRTLEKLKALGPLQLTVTLTDCLKSPCVDTPVVSYLDTFCQTLAVEKDTVHPQNMDALTLLDLDSGDICPLDQPVWENDANQWLHDLMDVLEDMSPEDLSDWMEDMSVEEWEQWMEDVTDHFDPDAFVT